MSKLLIRISLCLYFITPKLSLLAQSTSPVVYLEGMYATSTGLPFQQFNVTKVFDGDMQTYWKTIQGAGPDEGIMIYFSEPTYIRAIKPVYATGNSIAKISSFEVYGDGQTFYNGESIGKKLSSLYFKVANADGASVKNDPNGYSWSQFHSEYSVGIAELQLFGEGQEPLKVIAPKYLNGNITASSALMPDVAYGVVNLMDCQKEFAWAEGTKGKGIGEEIHFTFTENVPVSEIKIWNGYQRSTKHFMDNARLKTFRFGKKGEILQTYNLTDIEKPQLVKLKNGLSGKEYVMIVDAVYPGLKYEDLVISEFHFLNGKQPVLIRTDAVEKRVKTLREPGNPLLKRYLDRNITTQSYNESKTGTTITQVRKTSSLILRSNNTFVLYQLEGKSILDESEDGEMMEDARQTISDGGWELVEEGTDFIKIRIFGKTFSPNSSELYKGNVTSNSLRVFQDFLTITKDKIQGEKFVDDIIFEK